MSFIFKVNAIWIQFQCQRHSVRFHFFVFSLYYLFRIWSKSFGTNSKATRLSSKVDSTEWTGTYLRFISQRHQRLGLKFIRSNNCSQFFNKKELIIGFQIDNCLPIVNSSTRLSRLISKISLRAPSSMHRYENHLNGSLKSLNHISEKLGKCCFN